MIITIDFETYYDKEFSLSKMTTEEYVRDDRFEVIGVAVKIDDNETDWFSGTFDETKAYLDRYSWDGSFVVAHNAMFDASILTWRFGIRPMAWFDTLSMGRAVHGMEISSALASLAKHYELGEKGTEVINALGKRRLDFDAAGLALYGEYCRNDVELTYKLLHKLITKFQKTELKLIDITTKMFSEPVLNLDTPLLEAHLEEVKARKEKLLAIVQQDRESLMSNQKFAELLKKCGVQPPVKISPTTGKETLALAKSDEAFKALAEHPDERVQALVAARLGNKSTLEETRTERFIAISKRGELPIPLQYYAAHTGRWGGTDKINMQNLPSRGPNAGKLKTSILAPKGFVIIDSDSAQIEARVLAWLAGQTDLVEAFKNGEDVYKIMASAIYAKKPDEITKEERFVGKTTILGCIAEETPVLCDTGWKNIELITPEDRLWDGKEWVCHQGLLNSGIKKTLSLCGVWLTPDHKVWSGTKWLEAQLVVADENILSQVLGTAAENLPSQAIYKAKGWGLKLSSFNAIATKLNIWLTNKTSRILKAQDVQHVQKKLQLKKDIGFIQKLYLMMNTVRDYLTGCPQLSPVATTQIQGTTFTTENGVSKYLKNGETTEHHFLNTHKHLMDGTTQSLKWIALMLIKGMNQIILGLYHAVKTSETNEKSQTSNRTLQTYDIAFSGPRNRFTILTNRGPVIVHNCGYGMGAAKFKAQLKTFEVEVSDGEAAHIIETYRATYSKVPELWRQGQAAIEAMAAGQSAPYGNGCVVVSGRDGVLMPNGLYQQYPNLRKIIDEDGKEQYAYDSRRGTNKIYGGKLTENICQGLARCIIGEQMVRIAKRYKVVMTVHDSIVCVAPKEEAEEAKAYVEDCMKWVPDWAQGLPLNCETGYGENYGST